MILEILIHTLAIVGILVILAVVLFVRDFRRISATWTARRYDATEYLRDVALRRGGNGRRVA